MKKMDVLNLIKYHEEENDVAFREVAYKIAKEFQDNGDEELSEYILAQLSSVGTFVPQIQDNEMTFIQKYEEIDCSVTIPEVIYKDVLAVLNSIEHNMGINKFLFYGERGTGKTETIKRISKSVEKKLYVVNFENIIEVEESKTIEKILDVFETLNNKSYPDSILVVFDKIDSIKTDKEYEVFTKGFRNIDNNITVIATINNLEKCKANILNIFDKSVDFNRYNSEELIDIANKKIEQYIGNSDNLSENPRLFNKILKKTKQLPFPGEINKIIKKSISFSDMKDSQDYLRVFYTEILEQEIPTIEILNQQGFTVREIEVLTKIPKSNVSRMLQKNKELC